MRKDIAEALKRLGFEEAKPDDPIYKRGWSITFMNRVPRSSGEVEPREEASDSTDESG